MQLVSVSDMARLLVVLCWAAVGVVGFTTNGLHTGARLLPSCYERPSWGKLPTSFVQRRHPLPPQVLSFRPVSRRSSVHLSMVNFDSDDPFEVLGIDPTPNLDKSEIKRIYRRLALKYHPDVVTKQDSTDEDRELANKRFAKVNWAYELLSGKTAYQKGEKEATGATGSAGYEPPHRRKSAYGSNNSKSYAGGGGSTDWRDYMPNDDDDQYDTDGDSFGAIFSDLIMGAAGAAATGRGGGGIFKDFVDFLENNVDGYSGTSEDESELRVLLQMGSIDEVGNEMDDTDLIVQQLTSKLSNVDEELVMLRADLGGSTRFSEKLELEERIAELEARQKVVKGYIQKARKRLVKLQSRYKELIVGGADDRRGRSDGRRSSSSSSYSSSLGSSSNSYSRSPPPPSYSDSKTPPSSSPGNDGGSDWKSQSFGGRNRGSSRRRRSTRRQQSTSRSTQEPASSPSSSSQTGGGYAPPPSSAPRSSPAPPAQTTYKQIPPHRRTSPSTEDKARLRDLKVDEEFEKLKKELGL